MLASANEHTTASASRNRVKGIQDNKEARGAGLVIKPEWCFAKTAKPLGNC